MIAIVPQPQRPAQDRSVARKFDVHRFLPGQCAGQSAARRKRFTALGFIPLLAAHRGEPASLAWPAWSRVAPRRFVAPKHYFPAPQDRAIIVDFIAISKISSFRQNGGWRALRSSCRSNLRQCRAPARRTIIGLSAYLSMTLKTAGLVVATGRRARRHRARNREIALPRMGELVAKGIRCSSHCA